MKRYDIYLDDNLVGQAAVAEVGLFSEFSCICNFENTGPYRIKVAYEDRELDLGICVPEGNRFAINTKIPSKHLGKGDPRFRAVGNRESSGDFTPIIVNEPFQHVAILDKGRFVLKDTCPGMVFS